MAHTRPAWTLGRGLGSLASEARCWAVAAFGEPRAVQGLAKMAGIRPGRLRLFLDGHRELGHEPARKLADAIGFRFMPSGTAAQLAALPARLRRSLPHDAAALLKWAHQAKVRHAAIVEHTRPQVIGARTVARQQPLPLVGHAVLSNIAAGRHRASPGVTAMIAHALSMSGWATARIVMDDRSTLDRHAADVARERFLGQLHAPDRRTRTLIRKASRQARRVIRERTQAAKASIRERQARADARAATRRKIRRSVGTN